MATKQISHAEMIRRVARFEELKPSSQAFLDSLIPGHEREIYNVIGRGVTEDVTGFVMVEQVKSIDFRSRQARRIGRAPAQVLEEALSILDACIY